MAVRFFAFVALGLLLAGTGAAIRAQSLADVARQEAERRKALKDGGKIITNRDLPRIPVSPTGSAAAKPDANAPSVKSAADDKSSRVTTGSDEPKEPVKDQSYWAGRQKVLHDQLDRDQTYAEALQSRINALTTDFVNRDDPAQRAVIANDRQKALVELDRLKKAIIDEKKAIADFEEEARRAGVPPGWLR